MNEPHDPFEQELSALRPLEVSPELRRCVAERLAAARPSRLNWLAPLATGLAAACLLVMIFLWGGGRDGRSGPIAPLPRTDIPVAADDSTPKLLAYQRALARSPEDLGALLDKHSMANPGPGPELMQTLGVSRSNAELDTLLGDN